MESFILASKLFLPVNSRLRSNQAGGSEAPTAAKSKAASGVPLGRWAFGGRVKRLTLARREPSASDIGYSLRREKQTP